MTQQTLTQTVKAAGDSQEHDEQSHSNLPAFLQKDRLEPLLVVVTAAAIAASLLAERVGAPHEIILAINVISYIAGGLFGLQASIESLKHRELNVDLLMVLAAVGAAIVDQWHEGAILLF